jgi:hypothetical protein
MRSQTHHLVVVPDGGPLTGLAVGLSPRNAPQGSHLVLHVGPPSRRIPVRTVVLDRASDDVVIIGEALAARFDVDPNSTWSLESLAVVGANRITIELPVEQDLDAATNSIVNGGLPAQALLVGPDADSQYVDVNGIPYRVTAVEAPVRASESLVVVRPETRVDLFSPTVRTGVDIVILADTSGSMGAQDIPGPVEGLFAQRSHLITRMQALKSSLNALVDLRLETSGRISRIALVEFDGTTHHKFPRQGGMIELDGQSPRLLVEEFRTAVATMTPEGGTNIANALHEAANLLYRHGHPGNERLIVLISDGAHWTPKGEDAAGELIGGVDDPLTLLTHLHRETGIKMLGLGIGTKALFDAAYGRTQYAGNHTLVPDHELLIQLSKVTGIDPSVGGIAEFTKFFTELGSGLVQPVRGPRRGRRKPGRDRLRGSRSVGQGVRVHAEASVVAPPGQPHPAGRRARARVGQGRGPAPVRDSPSASGRPRPARCVPRRPAACLQPAPLPAPCRLGHLRP